jgi:hypothetical protein
MDRYASRFNVRRGMVDIEVVDLDTADLALRFDIDPLTVFAISNPPSCSPPGMAPRTCSPP